MQLFVLSVVFHHSGRPVARRYFPEDLTAVLFVVEMFSFHQTSITVRSLLHCESVR